MRNMTRKSVSDKSEQNQIPPVPPEKTQPAPNGEGAPDELDMDEFAVEAEAAPAPDEIDNLEDFALDQSFNPNEVEHDPPVPVRRPPPDVYFRTRPGDEHTLTVGICESAADDGERSDVYLVKRNMMRVFEGLVTQRQLFVCITAQGRIFLWPAKLPRPGRRSGGDRYTETALKGAELAKTVWTRVVSDQEFRCYRIKHPADPFPDPDWSKVPPLKELVRRGFGDGRVIGSPDHPEAKR